MAKSKRVSMSKTKMAKTGEELAVVGSMTELAGAMEVAEGVEQLELAQAAASDRRGRSRRRRQ